MKRPFAATVWREGNWYVSQWLEIDVASQGATEDEQWQILARTMRLGLVRYLAKTRDSSRVAERH